MALQPSCKEKCVADVLNTLRESWDMATLVGNDGYIYIARDKEHLKQLRQSNVDTTTSSSLSDIRGNISGGYGIFTGINRYTRTVTVE